MIAPKESKSILKSSRRRVHPASPTIADCFKYRNKIGLDVAIAPCRPWQAAAVFLDARSSALAGWR